MDRDYEEALVILMEECGELIQAASKCLRHGVNNYNPDTDNPETTNIDDLMIEMGHVRALVRYLSYTDFVRDSYIDRCAKQKLMKLPRWSSLDEKDLQACIKEIGK